jgi:DNA-binding response OmpR family regulator
MRARGFTVIETSASLMAARLRNEEGIACIVFLWPIRGPHDGLDLLNQLRDDDPRVVLVVVGIDIESQSVHAVLRSGADLCCRDASDPELLAVHIASWAARRRSLPLSKLRVGDLTVDLSGHRVWRGEVEISLTPIEFRLMVSLIRHAGEVVSKAQLLEECWRRHDDVSFGGGHLVEVHLAALRRKLHGTGPPILHTVRAHGFVLRPPGF